MLPVRELLVGGRASTRTAPSADSWGLDYRSWALGEELAEAGVLLATERADRRPAVRQQAEVCLAMFKVAFGLGETLVKMLVGLSGHENRGEGSGLHLLLVRQPAPR